MRNFPDPNPPAPDRRSPTRYLFRLAGSHRRTVALAIGYGVACTLAQALVPAAIGAGIDAGLIARNQRALVLWGCVIVGLGIIQAITGMLRDRCSVSNRFGSTYQTMQYLTQQASRLGSTLPKLMSAGEVVSVGAADITRIGMAFETAARGSGAVVAIIMVAGIMLATSWQLGLIVLAGVPLIAWLVALLMRPLHTRQHRLREQQGELTELAVDIVGGLRVLRGIGGEDVFGRRYRAESQRARYAGVRVDAVDANITAAQVLLPGLLLTAIVWLGAHYVLTGQIGAGQLVAFYGYAVLLTGQLRRVTVMVDQFVRAHVSAGRVIAILAAEPRIVSGTRTAPELAAAAPLTDPGSGLTIPPGQFVAVACVSPAQADLLADRLGRYEDSAVAYGGVALRDLPVPAVRRRILVANNDGRLFSGPLRTELDPADRAKADELDTARAMELAIDNASARDIIEALPDGLDSVIVGAGREFSGGQQQRLRLARALMADPDVLILVEPTNAVDAHTEARIARCLGAHRTGKTTVVFSTSPVIHDYADHVILVEGEKVAAKGTFNELVADPRYRAAVTRGVDAV